ncbi:MAG TPA: hypothetical protein VMD91_16435 [Candidatus Sulfotelmatobacter sp.]|nr:hypothetical protein [Candidatus Sulfotelmatobacter sp.]
MTPKRVELHVSEETAEQLKLRATFERRSVNEIVDDAIQEYAEAHPISRERMVEMARAIAEEDASLLQTLADA